MEPSHSSRGGRWETDYVPVWRPILDAASDYRTRQVTVMTCRQIGKTSAILNVLGHRFADGPRMPALLVMETQAKAKSMSNDRVSRLISDTHTLNSIHAKGKRDSVGEKWLAGVPLRMAWAGSAGALSSHPVGILLADEIEKWPADVSGEGDGLTIVKGGTITYLNHLIIVASSPTREDDSRIQDEFELGSMEVAEWPCLACGAYHRPLSMYLRYPKDGSIDDRAVAARYVCPHCDAPHGDSHKAEMMARFRLWPYERKADGDYVPCDSGEVGGEHRSYWISGFHSPWLSFRRLAASLIAAYASNDANKILSCLNVNFGELFRTAGDRPEVAQVRAHMQHYARGTRPWGVQYITAGVDVQKTGLYWLVRGWGCEDGPMQSWLIDHGFIWGNPAFDDVYIELDRILGAYHTNSWWIDSGYKPGMAWARPDHQIYAYARRTHGARAIRGLRTQGKPVTLSPQDVTLGGRLIKGGVTLGMVNTTHFKTWLYGRIRCDGEEAVDLWHLPRDIEDAYCSQVVAEEYVTKASGQGYYQAPRHRPNHYLDCECYATAAAWHYLENHRLEPLGAQDAQPVQLEEPGPRRLPGFGRPSAF